MYRSGCVHRNEENFTFKKLGSKSWFLNWAVRFEAHPQFIACWLDSLRYLITTVFANDFRILIMAIPKLEEIIHAAIMILNLQKDNLTIFKLVKLQLVYARDCFYWG